MKRSLAPIRLYRTRIAREIVAEFAVPRQRSSRALILCGGMPGGPGKRDVLESFARKGFWAIHPRYRGTWESGGSFLRVSPAEDVHDVIRALPRGLTDLWTHRQYHPRLRRIILLGSSFGGAAVLLAHSHPLVTATIALSPVVDWQAPSHAEPLGAMERYLRSGFGAAYRFTHHDWRKLATGTFFNPIAVADRIDGQRILIIHANDDPIVPWRSVRAFAEKSGAQLILLNRGGHLSTSSVLHGRIAREVQRFLRHVTR